MARAIYNKIALKSRIIYHIFQLVFSWKWLNMALILLIISGLLFFKCQQNRSLEILDKDKYSIILDSITKNQIISGFIEFYSKAESGELLLIQRNKNLDRKDTITSQISLKYDLLTMSYLRMLFNIIIINNDSVWMSYNGENFYFLSRNNHIVLKWSGEEIDIAKNHSYKYFMHLPIDDPEGYVNMWMKHCRLYENADYYNFSYDFGPRIYLNKKDFSLSHVIESADYMGKTEYIETIIKKQVYNKTSSPKWNMDERLFPEEYSVVDYSPTELGTYGLSKGNYVAEIECKTINNKHFRLSSFHGKIILLYFWYIGCAPCKKSIPSLLEINKTYNDVQIIGINPIDKDIFKIRDYVSENDIDFIQIHDIDKNIKEDYNVVLFPTLFLIDKEGMILKVYNGLSEENKQGLISKIDSLLNNI